MRQDRKEAREKLLGIKTKADLENYLSELNITDDEHEIALLVFGRGWSLTRISLELGFSIGQLRKKLSHIYDCML